MSFSHALRVQIRTFGAIFFREVRVQVGEGGTELLAGIAEPILHISVLCFWHYLVAQHPIYGPSTVPFISTGMYPTFIFIHLSAVLRRAIFFAEPERGYPVEWTVDVFLAQALLKVFVFGLSGVFIFTCMYYFIAVEAYPYRLDYVLIGFFSMAALGVGVGLCNAVIGRVFPVWHSVFAVLSRSLLIFSGVLFVPDFQPTFLRDWLVWTPTLHGIALFRTGFYPAYPQLCLDPPYLFGSILVVLVAGFGMERMFRKMKTGLKTS